MHNYCVDINQNFIKHVIKDLTSDSLTTALDQTLLQISRKAYITFIQTDYLMIKEGT